MIGLVISLVGMLLLTWAVRSPRLRKPAPPMWPEAIGSVSAYSVKVAIDDYVNSRTLTVAQFEARLDLMLAPPEVTLWSPPRVMLPPVCASAMVPASGAVASAQVIAIRASGAQLHGAEVLQSVTRIPMRPAAEVTTRRASQRGGRNVHEPRNARALDGALSRKRGRRSRRARPT